MVTTRLQRSALAMFFFVMLFCQPPRPNTQNYNFFIQTEQGETGLYVDLAKTEKKREKGLMFRKSLSDDAGMLFVYPNEVIPSFWMKNTLIPLDMIFFDGTGKVVFVFRGAEPFSEKLITPTAPCRTVLEVNAGFVNKYKIKAGNTSRFSN